MKDKNLAWYVRVYVEIVDVDVGLEVYSITVYSRYSQSVLSQSEPVLDKSGPDGFILTRLEVWDWVWRKTAGYLYVE